MGCPRKDHKKRCLLGILSRGMFCWKDKIKDRYIVSCAEERELKKEGKEDAENVNDTLRIKMIDGQNHYYTDRIVELMTKFKAIASERYNEEYIEKLTKSNEDISRFIEKGKKVLTDDMEDIRVKLTNSGIEEVAGNDTRAKILRTKAQDCMFKCLKDSTEIDVDGASAEKQAVNTLVEYDAYFSQELDFCLSKISTYWKWFRKTSIKIHGERYKDISLPDREVLMTICDVGNPAAGFKVVTYIDIREKVRAQKKERGL